MVTRAVGEQLLMQTWLDEFLGRHVPVETLNPEDAALVWQVAVDDDGWLDRYLTKNDESLFAALRLESDIAQICEVEEYAIEDDYDWIRQGC